MRATVLCLLLPLASPIHAQAPETAPDCSAYVQEQTAASEAAVRKALDDSARDPGWPGDQAVPPSFQRGTPDAERVAALIRLVSFQACRLERELVRDPAGFRLRNGDNPMYLWSVTMSDLEDPARALDRRLQDAFRWLEASSGRRRSQTLALIDPRGELADAYRPAFAARRDGGSPRERFLELAGRSATAAAWRREVERAAVELRGGASPAARRFHEVEGDLWRRLAAFPGAAASAR